MFDAGFDPEHAVGVAKTIRVFGFQVPGLHHHHIQDNDRRLKKNNICFHVCMWVKTLLSNIMTLTCDALKFLQTQRYR